MPAFDSIDMSSLPITWEAEGIEHQTKAAAPQENNVPIAQPTSLGCRFLLAETRYRAACLRFGRIAPTLPGYKHGERRINAASRLLQRCGDRILAKTPMTVSDIVDRAIVARLSMTEGRDGRWLELAGDHPDDKTVAELVLAVLTLAGLTNGKAERQEPSARPARLRRF